jgi:hypothetical protein
MERVRGGIIGGGFVSDIHAEAFQELPEAILVAAHGADKAALEEFGKKWKIRFTTADYRKAIERKDISGQVMAVGYDHVFSVEEESDFRSNRMGVDRGAQARRNNLFSRVRILWSV